MAIAKLKAYNVAFERGQTIAADYNAEVAAFPGTPVITNVSAQVNSGNHYFSIGLPIRLRGDRTVSKTNSNLAKSKRLGYGPPAG